MNYYERMANIQPANAAIHAHIRVLSGQNEQGQDLPPDRQDTPGRRFLLGLYAARLKRGETLPDEMLNWEAEFRAYKPPKLSPHHVLSMQRQNR